MEATAKLRNYRTAPRKLRLLADLVRTKPVGQAINELRFSQKRGAKPLTKLIESAIANAVDKNPEVDVDRLRIKTITVDQGPNMWRIRARAQGRASWIQRRTTNVCVVLAEK